MPVGLLPPDALSGKEFTQWDEELQYDIYYAQNCSFFLDFKIFIKSIKIVFNRNEKQYGEIMRPHLNVERADRRRENEVYSK